MTKTKQYTAQEMRDAILKLKAFQGNKMTLLRIEDMLRQAADAMERKKKYEYAEKFKEGIVSYLHREKPMDRLDMYRGSVNVRREVGEWEEVEE